MLTSQPSTSISDPCQSVPLVRVAQLRVLSVLFLVLIVGLALRVASLQAEFWLDEILSWQLARQAGDVAGVFAVHHDNNHHLNTLWLTLCPDVAPSWCYRLQALLAGVASIAVAAWIAHARGRAEAVFAAVLVASNYWLVLASAEARGYACAVLLALLGYEFLRRYLDVCKRLWLMAFWLACILGFLSHLSFVQAYVGFVLWSLRRFAREHRGTELRRLIVCHAGVAVFFAPFYLLCIRGMEIAGAPPAPLLPVIERLVVVGLGGPDSSLWGLPWIVAFGVLLALGTWRLHKEGNDAWLFFFTCVFASPVLFLARRPPFVFERYFLISFVFFLLLLSCVLGWLWQRHRGAVVLGLLLIVAGNGWHVLRFVDVGRGQFAEALARVQSQGPATITGDNDFRVRAYVEFHGATYVERAEGADWLFAHRLDDRHPPALLEHDDAGHTYRLVREYPSRGRGAWGWFVYRRIPCTDH